MKKILTIQDISCASECSTMVALPILAALKQKVAIMPIEILSTHTGGYKNVARKDLQDMMDPISKHWQKYNIDFDIVYTGYFSNIKQIYKAMEMIKSNTCLIVDPAIADKGVLYSSIELQQVDVIKELCRKAYVITPNITEACILAGFDYKDNFTEDEVEELIKKLSLETCKNVIITGVSIEDKLATAIYNNEIVEYIYVEKINGNFYGTGDIFASVLTGCIAKGYSINQASKIAVDFIQESLEKTGELIVPFGVNYQLALKKLVEIKQYEKE